MVLSFGKEQPPSATVDVLLSTAADDEETSAEEITATRVNPHTYTFSTPPGQQYSYTGSCVHCHVFTLIQSHWKYYRQHEKNVNSGDLLIVSESLSVKHWNYTSLTSIFPVHFTAVLSNGFSPLMNWITAVTVYIWTCNFRKAMQQSI